MKINLLLRRRVDQKRCNHYGLYLDVCLQGTIIEVDAYIKRELKATANELKDRTEDI